MSIVEALEAFLSKLDEMDTEQIHALMDACKDSKSYGPSYAYLERYLLMRFDTEEGE